MSLFHPMDCSPPGTSVLGILQARILEWAAMSSCRGASQPRDRTCVSYICCIGSGFFITSATWDALRLVSCFFFGLGGCKVSSIAGLTRYTLEGMGYFQWMSSKRCMKKQAYDTHKKYRMNEQLYKWYYKVRVFNIPTVRTWGLTCLGVFYGGNRKGCLKL